MTLKIPNASEGVMLEMILNKDAAEDQVLCLYQNDVTPGETDVIGTYTEATFTGYSAASLSGSSWTVTPGAPSEASYAQQTFTSSAGSQNQSIYGYYVKRTTTGDLLWAERFTDGPYTIVNNGDEIRVTAKLTLQDTTD